MLTVFLALGAWRHRRAAHVLTRRMPAIETLGAATVLCVDKTGTLTQNRMTVRAAAARPERPSTVDAAAALPRGAARAARATRSSPAGATVRSDGARAHGARATRLLRGTEHLHPGWRWCASTRSPTSCWR